MARWDRLLTIYLAITLGSPATASERSWATPQHDDFIKVLQDIDGEFCRRMIDLCENEIDRDDYDIVTTFCSKPNEDRIQCSISEREGYGIVRKCKVTLERSTDEGRAGWYLARGKIGGDARALLASCKSK